ncbi:hypothetical protein NPIL_646631 [Nephila pilipes]|uniref:Uncharacterized protein n=1 Tax=Nephila pilipes TaxID=299642 RepID=A0A8X6QPG5_NEPPI|nr:hypothetical protein NPIL_646631 [Nephila pilipes]
MSWYLEVSMDMKEWIEDVKMLHLVKIQRQIFISNVSSFNFQLFCDARGIPYAAVVFFGCLSQDRAEESAAFEVSGVDLAGPFTLKALKISTKTGLGCDQNRNFCPKNNMEAHPTLIGWVLGTDCRNGEKLLRRVLGNVCLYYEELVRILCDCEAVVNSRLLIYLSEDSNDLIRFTPSIFI